MREILDIQKKLLPDLVEVMQKRYTILHLIMISRLIGRRTLASALNMTERVLRGELDFLKAQGLLETDSLGMRLTDSGLQVLEEMEPMIKHLFGLTELEDRIQQGFNVAQVVVVPGDSDLSPFVKKELGRSGAAILRKMVSKNGVIAVTGGSTMAEVANHLRPIPQFKGSLFVPARGGLGESLELQANTIASNMAKKTGCQYRLLHVPDHLGEDAYQSLIQDANINEMLQVIRTSRIVIHGIGEALVMARRRKVDSDTVKSLKQDGALAEAFG
jgi:central glycolytic genes regulator